MLILKIINTVEKLKGKNMIKLATMSSVCPDWTLNDVVTGMKRHGYQGFEPRVEWGHASGIEVGHSGAQRKEVRAQMEGEGLAICCMATGARMAAPMWTSVQNTWRT